MVGATPATQNACGCEIVPRLPRETKVDVTKCHACHAQCRGVTRDQGAPKPDPSAPPSAMSATPATQNDGGCEIVPRLPRKTKVDASLCYACHVKRRWMSSLCHACHVKRHQVPRLPRKRHPVPWVPRLTRKLYVRDGMWQIGVWKMVCDMVCDKVVCGQVVWEQVEVLYVKDGVWQSCVCPKLCVKFVCVKRWYVKVVCVCLSVCPKLCVKFVCVKRWYVTKLCAYECMLSLCVCGSVYERWYVTSFVLSLCVWVYAERRYVTKLCVSECVSKVVC